MDKIKLLDGHEYSVPDLLTRMMDDSFYYGELNTLALSSSALKLLLESPKKYYGITKYAQKLTSQPLRDGFLLHTLILEPKKFDKLHFVDVISKNSKAYKDAVAEFGIVYTSKEKKDAERVADALLRNEKALQFLSGAEFEIPAIGLVQGMPFRGKADIISKDILCDIKTTTDIKGFPYAAKKYGYDVQCYLYCELFGKHFLEFVFLVIDKGSLDIAEYRVSEEFYNKGKEKVTRAIATYKEFIEGKDWKTEISEGLDNYYIKGEL
jgi:hypothetical protein|tara:strand:- start:800 stop:1597 length:798 start_codon:yes stop_codon:yes gene_type:complete